MIRDALYTIQAVGLKNLLNTIQSMKHARSAIRELYRTGFFQDVALGRDGNILVISVRERPAIANVSLSGNKAIKEEELRRVLFDIGLSEDTRPLRIRCHVLHIEGKAPAPVHARIQFETLRGPQQQRLAEFLREMGTRENR